MIPHRVRLLRGGRRATLEHVTETDADWERLLGWVVGKTGDALIAEGNYRGRLPRQDPGKWLRGLDRLRVESDRWRRLRAGVITRNPAICDEARTAMQEDESR